MGMVRRIGFLTGLVCALAACDLPTGTQVPGNKPTARPAQPAPKPVVSKPSVAPKQPSAQSVALADYYKRVQADLLVQGLLRTDGGGPDTPFTDTILLRNFERIALAEEYARGGGLRPGNGELGRVKKWIDPVRISVEFGANVPQSQRGKDAADVTKYAARLARITGHPITTTQSNPNFHVLFMSEDDKSEIRPRVQQIVPNINAASLAIFDNLPRSIHCLVIAFSGSEGGYDYARAIALIRSEHPDLLRLSCIHEEIAQGLGLGNDSPQARPSIFNDDDEFALLTTHDEQLLKMLYTPSLRPGMTAEQARDILRPAISVASTGGPT